MAELRYLPDVVSLALHCAPNGTGVAKKRLSLPTVASMLSCRLVNCCVSSSHLANTETRSTSPPGYSGGSAIGP